jgi:hypothetical protein
MPDRTFSRAVELQPAIAPGDPERYRRRTLIERLFNKLKHPRRISTGYNKLATNLLAADPHPRPTR